MVREKAQALSLNLRITTMAFRDRTPPRIVNSSLLSARAASAKMADR
jgi:hypothetical protein